MSEIFMNLSIAAVFGTQVFMPCYFGSQLEDDTNAFISKVMESDVLDVHHHCRKDISIFQLNLMMPSKVNTLKIFPANLNTFIRVNRFNFKLFTQRNYVIQIINSTYSLFAVFKNFRN